MSEVFSSNREYDFVRQEALSRVTGRPAHEWDIYILKELIDNALDADELLWQDDLQHQELAPVILDNNWLCRMDMALLHVPIGIDILEEGLGHCMQQSELPVLVLHDGTDEGYAMVERFSTGFHQHHWPMKRLIDLQPARNSQQAIHPMKFMTGDLETWLLQRFTTLGIARKCLPLPNVMRKDIHVRFEQLLHAYLFEDMGHYFALDKLSIELGRTIDYTKIMIHERLDERVKDDLIRRKSAETYTTALDDTVHDFFKYFVSHYGHIVRQKGQEWIIKQQNSNDYE